MSLGLAGCQGNLFDDVRRFCDETLPEKSVYRLMHRERGRLFADELFTDLFCDQGRRSVPPSVVATVMVVQRLEGLSDREAVERYTFRLLAAAANLARMTILGLRSIGAKWSVATA